MSADLKFQYQQIAQKIKDQIVRGEIRVGERLKSERLLGEQFGVQRNTIRQALAALENDGHISTKKRQGSFVLPPIRTLKGGSLVVNIRPGSGPNGTALYEGIAKEAEKVGLRLVRTSTDPLPNSTMNRVPDIADLPPDTVGAILWPHHPTDIERLKRLSQEAPLVLVDHRVMGASIDCVRFDDVEGGKMVAEHLIQTGHRRIAFLADEVFAESVHSRWQGYVVAHDEAGIPCDHRLSLLYQFMDTDLVAMTLRHLLSSPETRPTAIICSNDLVAFALLRLLNAEGLRVPEDIAVTGYGNSIPDYTAAIALTTIDQPFYEMGQKAARLLIERTRQTSSERLQDPQDIFLPVSLVKRGTTAIPSLF